MRKKLAVLSLALVLVCGLYLVELIFVRISLRHEKTYLLNRLSHLRNEDMLMARAMTGLSAEGARSFKSVRMTVYSSEGIPVRSDFPPVSPAPRREKGWRFTRWLSADGALWIETILNSGRHWAGVALPAEKSFLQSENSRIEIGVAKTRAGAFDRWSVLLVFPPGEDRLEPGAARLYERYHWGWGPLAANVLLAWILIGYLRRFLSVGHERGSKRESQLQEEMAYLSHTYQELSKSLRLERQKVESILNSAPDGIFTCSPEGNVTFWNRSMESLTGVPKNEILGKHYDEVLRVQSSQGQQIVDPFSPCLREGNNLSLLDCRIEIAPQPSGSPPSFEGVHAFPVALGAAPIKRPDQTVEEVVVTVKDLRTQKEAEQFKRDMQAMIAHDLRAPLSAMLGYAGLIQDPRLCKGEEERAKYLDSLVRTGKGMLALIGNLLGWAGIEEGKMAVNLEPVSVKPILQEAVAGMEILAKPKNISLTVNVKGEPWAVTDKEKLKEILNNLLSNAVKFTRQGEIVEAGAWATTEGVRMEVRDCGPGLSPEERENLFEKFSTVKKQGSGTGLGLFIVKTLATALGAQVEVASEEGVGSVFAVILPLHERRAEIAPEAGAAPPELAQPKQLSLL